MQGRFALIVLAFCWVIGFLPAANVGFESTSVQLNLIETAPAIAALLFVTTGVFGLASYLRKSLWPVAVAIVTALAQWLPVLSLTPKTPPLLAKYAQLSGIDLSNSGMAPDTIQVLPTVWLLPATSITLAIILIGWFTNRRNLTQGRSASAVAVDVPLETEEASLWESQLLESREQPKEKHAR